MITSIRLQRMLKGMKLKDLAKKVSSQQLVKAFRMLRAITDPFEYETSEQSREVKERLAGIPPQILTQAMSVTQKP